MPPRAVPLLRRFVDARLLVTDRDTEGREIIEVAHEALLRTWPQLTTWLAEDQNKLRLLESLQRAAEEWDKSGRRPDLLVHRNGRLQDIVAYWPTRAQSSTRLGDARKIRVTNSGTRVFAAGDRAVQEAIPLYIWRWDPDIDSVEEVYMQGASEEYAELKLFEMSPPGDLFVLDFLGLHYLKQSASGQLEEVQVSSDSVEELFFDLGRNCWLGRKQHSFVKIDPFNGQVTEVLVGDEGIGESVQNRLLSASGKYYVYRFQMQDGVKVQ